MDLEVDSVAAISPRGGAMLRKKTRGCVSDKTRGYVHDCLSRTQDCHYLQPGASKCRSRYDT